MQQMKAQMIQLGGECKGEVGAGDGKFLVFLFSYKRRETRTIYISDDIAPMLEHKPPNTPKGKCFVACMNKKMGFVSILNQCVH